LAKTRKGSPRTADQAPHTAQKRGAQAPRRPQPSEERPEASRPSSDPLAGESVRELQAAIQQGLRAPDLARQFFLQPEKLRRILETPRAVQEFIQAAKVLPDLARRLGEQQDIWKSLADAPKAHQDALRLMMTMPALQSEWIRRGSKRTGIPSFTPVRGEVRPSPTPDVERAIPEIKALKNTHAPPHWRSAEEKRFTGAIRRNQPLDLIVLAADINRSSALMREAVNPYTFASILEGFTEVSRNAIWETGGIFDKFTGDGFLAYWRFTQGRKTRTISQVLDACRSLHRAFIETHGPLLRGNSRNFPSGVGLSLGLDEGPTNLVAMAGDPTIVGPAVVGAVRMIEAAGPGETLANVILGEYLIQGVREEQFPLLAVTPDRRPTKEYEEQAVYALTFTDLVLPEL
jgi:class 3 adenylate cyclase